MQLDLIQWLQSFHSPTLDQVMVWISQVGSEDFYLLFGPLFFWCVGVGMGVRLLVALVGSFYVNDVLKNSFDTVRPMLAHPDVVRMPAGADITAQDEQRNWQAAFPSGHAQHTVVFWAFVGLWLRRPLVWALALTMIVLVSISRIYLGVHWPIDILGGWLIGAIVIAAVTVVPATIERLSPAQRERVIIAAAALGIGLFLIDDSAFRAKMLGFWSGSLLALLVQQRYVPFKVSGAIWMQLAKIAIGLVGVFILRAVLKTLLPDEVWAAWLRYALLGVWVVLGAPALFRLLFGLPPIASQADSPAQPEAEQQVAA
jgi:membrane-associated phospholipid phosphatase